MNKILYVHHSVSYGGAPRSLAFLISHLDKNKYEPFVLCFCDEGNKELFEPIAEQLIIDKRMRPFHGSTVSGMTPKLFLSGVIYFIPTVFLTARYIKKIRPDIIHLNSTCLFPVAVGAKLASRSIKIVTHIREPLLPGFFGNILRFFNNLCTDEYIAIDKFDADSVHANENKMNVIYNFVDDDFKIARNEEFRKKYEIKESDVVLLYLARISKENGVLELLQVYLSYLNCDNVKLIIAGDRGMRDSYSVEVRKLCAKSKSIILLPFSKNVQEIIAASDVGVSPFVQPHFSRAVIETAMMGIPHIGNNIGGVNELIDDGKTGFLVDIRNQKEFAEKLLLLINDPNLRKKMGMAAEEKAKRMFSASSNAEQTFDVYRKLLNH